MTNRSILPFIIIVAFSQHSFSQKAHIVIDANNVVNRINPTMYGSCIEDVNHEIYGGLYDQRLYGESFEEPPVYASGPTHSVSGMWDAVQKEANGSAFFLDSANAFNGRQAQVIQHAEFPGIVGVANGGLNRWGISVRKHQKWVGRLYLRAQDLKGPVWVALQSRDGRRMYACQQLNGVSGQWQKFTFTLVTNDENSRARFVIFIKNSGKLWIDQAVLMTTGRDEFKGLPIRNDIARKMQTEGLTFLRYGGSMVNAPGYRWKKMIGDPDRRPPYIGTWYPYSSNGFGMEDFLKYCETAGFEPAFAINIEETAQDAADMTEYLKGDLTTPWGRKRAENGHPAPYKVKYIEIGNEEAIDSDSREEYGHYVERFTALYNAIHAKSTDIRLICAAWWRPESSNVEDVFRALDGKASYWDLHTEADQPGSGKSVDSVLTAMQAHFLKWDSQTTMRCTIFEENGDRHDLQRALGHATTLNATRRHGDFLLSSCAANGLQALGQNDNGWDQGQIFYTPGHVWGMPPYYAQQMAALNHLPLRVQEKVTGDLDVAATRSKDDHTLVIHIVNTDNVSRNASIVLTGFGERQPNVQVWTLANINKKGTLIMPTQGAIDYTFPPRSYTILRFSRREHVGSSR
jgi:alpha-L-arabinofuranosidase